MIIWYAIGIAPLLLYVYSVVATVPDEQNGPFADWIYVCTGCLHHLGLFKTVPTSSKPTDGCGVDLLVGLIRRSAGFGKAPVHGISWEQLHSAMDSLLG